MALDIYEEEQLLVDRLTDNQVWARLKQHMERRIDMSLGGISRTVEFDDLEKCINICRARIGLDPL
ncbi:MAG: hypothetical protein FWD45_00145 [Coriobacteriia bacterium]|nr:hypothetical protein [Coriobacteriia bacterium]